MVKANAVSMQPTQLEFGISRKEAIAVLSRIRYGQDSQRILNQSTIWRWCDALGIPSGTREFYESEVNQLKALATHLRRGYLLKDFVK